jgi:hypothetical protein
MFIPADYKKKNNVLLRTIDCDGQCHSVAQWYETGMTFNLMKLILIVSMTST